jgi:hypothetical protein
MIGVFLWILVDGGVVPHSVKCIKVQALLQGAREAQCDVSSGTGRRVAPFAKPAAGSLEALSDEVALVRSGLVGPEALESRDSSTRQ